MRDALALFAAALLLAYPLTYVVEWGAGVAVTALAGAWVALRLGGLL